MHNYYYYYIIIGGGGGGRRVKGRSLRNYLMMHLYTLWRTKEVDRIEGQRTRCPVGGRERECCRSRF